MRKLLLSCILFVTVLTTSLTSMAARKAGDAPKAPTPIYRCDNIYQSSPCDADSSALPQKLVFHDRQTVEQRRAAQQSAKQLHKQAQVIDKGQKKALDALQRKPPKAIGLSCHQPGTGPFETCNAKPNSDKSKNALKKERKQQDTRPKQGPYLSPAPQ